MNRAIELIIRFRSSIGTACLIAVLIIATPNARSISIGFFLIVLGMFFRGWSSGYIHKNEQLACRGPYALTRNPLYFGSFLIGSGIATAANNLPSTIIFMTYFLLFFPLLIIIERKRMKNLFPEQYAELARTSNLFIPKIKKIDSSNFNIAFYFKNKEYRVLYFSLIVIAVFIVKYLIQIGSI